MPGRIANGARGINRFIIGFVTYVGSLRSNVVLSKSVLGQYWGYDFFVMVNSIGFDGKIA